MEIKKKTLARMAGLSAAAYAYAHGMPFPTAASRLVEELIGVTEMLSSEEGVNAALATIFGDCDAACYWLKVSETDSYPLDEKEKAREKALDLLIKSYFRFDVLKNAQKTGDIAALVGSLFLLQGDKPGAKAEVKTWFERAIGHYQICLAQISEPKTLQQRVNQESDFVDPILQLQRAVHLFVFKENYVSSTQQLTSFVASTIDNIFLKEKFEKEMQEFVESKQLLEKALADITALANEF